jgi:hypothetical protein
MAREVMLLLEITDVSMTRGLRDTSEHLEPTTQSRMSGSQTRDVRSRTLSRSGKSSRRASDCRITAATMKEHCF